jgi:demethylmenaquinone methyltransferase/2-methoxy-6-polyprenyl-1,4-benzoquinol methylase
MGKGFQTRHLAQDSKTRINLKGKGLQTRHLALDSKTRINLNKYRFASIFYDILDYPWERIYRKWRPFLVGDMRGSVLEAGVGTGRNIKHYHSSVDLTCLDLSPEMLNKAVKRAKGAKCCVRFVHEDVCSMQSISSGHYDWIMAGFLCCVLPNELQSLALEQIVRVLKPGGRFRLLEMIYSNNPQLRRRQNVFAPIVETLYGARFDRETIKYAQKLEGVTINETRFLKNDVYLLIEGMKDL